MMKSDGIPTITKKKFIDEIYKEGHLYAPYGAYERKAHGYKIFKVPLNASFTCPNWDGRLSKEGCIFCPNFARQFTYESFRRVIDKDIKEQVSDQMEYYKKKSGGKKGIVYIAFGTNTYYPVDKLKEIYKEEQSSYIRKLLWKSVAQEKLDYAINQYLDDKISLGRSCEIAGISIWEMLDELHRRNITLKYKISEAELEIEKILKKYKKIE